MALTSGTKLGPFEILAPLGAGGMGEVYCARDTRLDRTVAIKILSSHLSSSPEAKQRFEREARAISSLNHPNICTLYDVGHQNGIDFLVMEYLEGETLADRLRKGPLPPEQVLKYGIEICEWLEKAHKNGVIHRDLKPGNIMLTKSGAKLMDFGLAKATTGRPPSSSLSMTLSGPSADLPLTAQGMVVGTFQYMSPEQVEGKDADARSDIFALGAVLFEMATGTRAFEGKTTASVIAAVLERNPAPISTVQPMSPPSLDEVVKTCLAKDPEERWQSARDVRLQLDYIRRGGLKTRATLQPSQRLPWGVAAICLLATLALSIGLLLRTPKPIAAKPIRFSIVPPDEASVSTGSLAISPDGRNLVFNTAGSLWVRSLDALSPRRLEGTSGALYPFWSPDQRFIGFFANGKLKKIPPTGVSSPEEVCVAARAAAGGTWNQDGIILFSVDGQGIFRVSASGGEPPVPVTTLDPTLKETNHWWPYFLPDGHHFLYVAEAASASEQGRIVYLASLDSGKRARLLNSDAKVAYSAPGYLLFLRNRALLAQRFDLKHLRLSGDPFPIAQQLEYIRQWGDASFAVSDTGVLTYVSGEFHSSLVWFDRTGREIGTVGQPAEYVHVELSPVGEKAAVEIIDPNSKAGAVWLIDLKRGISSRLTFNPAWEYFPVWSPDGSRILFDSSRDLATGGSEGDLFIKSSAGAQKEELLLKSELWKWPNDWSPDGRYILFHALDPNTKADLWVLPLNGDRTPHVFLQTEFSEEFGQFSPDGHFVAYVSDESGRQEVYVRPFPASDIKWQISSNGGHDPKWRRDGKELMYEAPDGKLMSVKVKLLPSFQAETSEPLFNPHFGDWMSRHQYALSVDGQRILAIVRNETLPIIVVADWSRDLEQK